MITLVCFDMYSSCHLFFTLGIRLYYCFYWSSGGPAAECISRKSGSVRGVPGNRYSYRDLSCN